MPTESAAYRFDELGWLQFERLCEFVLDWETGLADLDWRKHADVGRVVSVMDDVALAHAGVRLAGPVAVARVGPSRSL